MSILFHYLIALVEQRALITLLNRQESKSRSNYHDNFEETAQITQEAQDVIRIVEVNPLHRACSEIERRQTPASSFWLNHCPRYAGLELDKRPRRRSKVPNRPLTTEIKRAFLNENILLLLVLELLAWVLGEL